MALPHYFERNAQAISTLIRDLDVGVLADRLNGEVIGIVYDKSAEESPEARSGIDLAIRLLARIYPALLIHRIGKASEEYASQLRDLAKQINPAISTAGVIAKATRILVFGKTAFKVSAASRWYVGSDKWRARLSMSDPVSSGSSANPFGAGVAACVAVANVFRAVFSNEIGSAALDSELDTSVWTLQATDASSPNPELGNVTFEDLHLVGAGAIGHGALWAISKLQCSGVLHVVDPEKVSDSNLQRYVMAVAKDKGKDKVALARSVLKDNKRIKFKRHSSSWSEHIAAIPGHRASTVLSAVDSAQVRIQIQASLPFRIFNGWTQRGEAGVSRHRFLGDRACLACLYMPHGQAVNEDVLVARALKLGEDEATIKDVRQRLQRNLPTDKAFLGRIAHAAGVTYEKLSAFEGRLLRDFYVEAVCGGQVMEFHSAARDARADVPMAFQSALSGILLIAELARGAEISQTVTQIDLLSTYPERPGTPKQKSPSPRCICLDADFIDVYKQKYRDEIAVQSPS